MPIRKVLAKSLRSLQPTQVVEDVNDVYVQQTIMDLLDTLQAEQHRLDQLYPQAGAGVGLAANQIEYPYQPLSSTNPAPAPGFYPSHFIPPQIYVIAIRPERAKRERCVPLPATVYINASLIPWPEAGEQASCHDHEEACLSLVGIQAPRVPRYEQIQVTALTPTGAKKQFVVSGFLARVHQHEADHNAGKEYLNHLSLSIAELQMMQSFIKNHQGRKLDLLPLWIIPNKLQCIVPQPDLVALQAWVDAVYPQHAKK